ncbi:hypothetical protein ACV22V_28210, partial [Burkholderia sp. AW33-5]
EPPPDKAGVFALRRRKRARNAKCKAAGADAPKVLFQVPTVLEQSATSHHRDRSAPLIQIRPIRDQLAPAKVDEFGKGAVMADDARRCSMIVEQRHFPEKSPDLMFSSRHSVTVARNRHKNLCA